VFPQHVTCLAQHCSQKATWHLFDSTIQSLKFKEKTAWMTEHVNIDDFVASWERQEHVPLMPLYFQHLKKRCVFIFLSFNR
jgi:hypothetical protein